MSQTRYSQLHLLVYGHKGWIGQQFTNLCEKFHIQFSRGQARCDNFDTVRSEIQQAKSRGVTHVISFIGRTHGTVNNTTFNTIDYLEQKGKLCENLQDNLCAPLVLANVCKSQNVHYTYLGTGCIFTYDNVEHLEGVEANGFTEESSPNFHGSSYSVVKGYTDTFMRHMFSDTVLNLRIRMPITGTVNKRNFITKITRYEKICNMPNSMTVLPELLPMIFDLMQRQIVGTLNFTNPGLISHNEILTMYRDIVDPSFSWKNFTVEEQNAVLQSERSNNFLDTTRLQVLCPYVLPIKESVRNCLQEYKRQLLSSLPPEPPRVSDTSSSVHGPECILVTGGCGFIGSNFIQYMFETYPQLRILNIDALYYSGSVENIQQHIRDSPRYTFIQGNIQSFDLLRHIFSTNTITHVVHFAAQSHVDTSFSDSLNYTRDNILGTHTLLEVNRLLNPHLVRFVHISTDEVYGESVVDATTNKKTEFSVLAPTNPYAATKAGAELIAQSYIHSYSMPIIITRGNNVYGPNQYPEKLIPKFILQLLTGKKITIQGHGDALRTFLHSEDTARAVDIVMRRGTVGEIYNIGGLDSMEYTVLEVGKLLIDLVTEGKASEAGSYSQYMEFVEDRPFNDKRYYISSEKLKKLGWSIRRTNFRQELQKLIENAKKTI